ncbi:MAG: TIGR03619 family F420-dependent LLM class oxidoreductase [Chloroflexi bacterium]|nr:TIGR03619 family F420-dependent LLM class oxidoreductase [Chloroflexota bacterium]
MAKIRYAAMWGGSGELREVGALEELGYAGTWFGDHVMTDMRPLGDILTSMAAAAMVTKELDLISGVLLLPLRHPVPVTKALTNIDHLSKGRLTVGVGVGGEYPAEWEACGVPVRERGARMDEALEVVTRLWTEEHVDHEGRFYPLRDVTLTPKPYQRPHPPIWLGGRREASQRRAARYGAGWIPYLVTPERYEAGLRSIERYADECGRKLDMGSFTRAILVFVGLTDLAEYDPSKDPTRPDRKKGSNYYLIGDTKECIARLQEFATVGVEYFTIGWVCDPKEVQTHIRHFAEHVAPHVR